MNTQTLPPSNDERPEWDPMKDFPLELATQQRASLIGALLAATEHLQIIATRSRDRTVSSSRHKAALANPAVHCQYILDHARHHLARSRRCLGLSAYEIVLDELAAALGNPLPLFIPQPERWAGEHGYRVVRRHLRNSYQAFYEAYGLWKERSKVAAGESEALEDEDEGEDQDQDDDDEGTR